jgi:hypothetical protein
MFGSSGKNKIAVMRRLLLIEGGEPQGAFCLSDFSAQSASPPEYAEQEAKRDGEEF